MLRVLSLSKFIGLVLNTASLCGTPTSTATPHPYIQISEFQFKAETHIKAQNDQITTVSRTYIVNAFKGGYHGVDVTRALHGSVDSTVCHLDKHLEHNSTVSIWHSILQPMNKLRE